MQDSAITIANGGVVGGGVGGLGGLNGGGVRAASAVGGAGIIANNSTITVNAGGILSGGLPPIGITVSEALIVGSGTNVLNLGGFIDGNIGLVGGTLRINAAAGGSTFANVITGAGGLIQDSANTLTLTGMNTYTGATQVISGRLAVNGSIASSFQTAVTNGGTLGGTGTVGATFVLAGGTIGAGNSIGTLNVAGSLSMNSGSIMDVEVNDGGNVASVNNDLIAATDAVSINTMASVVVRPTNGTDTGATYAPNTRYTIVTAGIGVVGTFGSISDQFAFLDASLDYDLNNVYLTLTRNDQQMVAVGQTPNQRAAAGALAQFPAGDAVTTALLNSTTTGAQRAFELSSGDANASAQFVIDRSFSLFGSSLKAKGAGEDGSVMSFVDAGAGQAGVVGTGEAVTAPILPNSLWLTPLGGRGTLDSDGNGPGAEWTAGGLAAGYERHTVLGGGDATFGLGLGYLNTDVSVPSRLASADAQGGHAGIYGEWSDGAAQVSGSLTAGDTHVSSSRTIAFGGINRTASADYWMQNVGVQLEASYGFKLTDAFSVGPVGGLDIDWSGHDGYSETGAGNLNATVGSSSLWTANTELGVAMAYQLGEEAGAFTLKSRALWLHNWADTSAQSSIALAGGGLPFTVDSPEVGRDRLEVGAGLSWSPTDATKVSLDYTGRFFGGQDEHVLAASLAVSF